MRNDCLGKVKIFHDKNNITMNEVIGIPEEKARGLSQSLNQILAEMQLYYQNLRIFHWRVTGPQFFTLHAYFEELYQAARADIDAVAERILTIGGTPEGNWSRYLQMAVIPEASGKGEAEAMVSEVIDNHRVLIENLRRGIDKAQLAEDEGTADMLTGMLQALEKSSWMLQAWRKGVMV